MTDTISMLENNSFGHSADTPTISMIGTRAMLFEAPGAFTLACQRRIWALMDACADRADIEEVMPGVTNLMLIFSVPPEDPEAVADWLRKAWATLPEKHIKGRLFEVGVRYGGELGSDLPRVAEHCGMSAQDVIALHQAPLYTVCAWAACPALAICMGWTTPCHPTQICAVFKNACWYRHYWWASSRYICLNRAERLEFHRLYRPCDV